MSTRKFNIAVDRPRLWRRVHPLWQKHPHTECYAICQRNEQKLNEVGDYWGVPKRYSSYEELLKDPNIDAVHINSPIPNHGEQSIAALKAGKHVACTVPMATSVEDCLEIIRLTQETGLKYMMMETVVYAREYLFMKELRDQGELGKVQFIQASHQQDMDGWPNYWPGLPPMWYATHCVGPVLGLAGGDAEYVSCFGSGTIREELVKTTAHLSRSRLRTSRSATPIFRPCDPQPLRYGAAVSRKHRRVRQQEDRRVAPGRARAARHPHREEAEPRIPEP
jgi:predicted dehydrogenase